MRSRNYATRYPTAHSSMLVSELVVGAVTGVTAVRRMFIRIILVVAVLAAIIAFAAGLMLGDYLANLPDLADPAQSSHQTERPPTLVPASVPRSVTPPAFRP